MVNKDDHDKPDSGLLFDLLNSAVAEPSKIEYVRQQLEKIVYDKPKDDPEGKQWEIFEKLLYELEFYVEDKLKRVEDKSFFGKKRAIKFISSAIFKLKKLGIGQEN